MTTRSVRAAALVCTVAALFVALATRAEDEAKHPKRKTPLTTSKVTGSPEPPPKFKSVRAFANAKFDHPALIARAPGSTRLFVGEQTGTLYSLSSPDAKPDVFIDLRKEFAKLKPRDDAKGIGELYGLAFHPEFSKNRTCFVCYTLAPKGQVKDGRFADGTRVSRFKVTDTNPPRIDPSSEEIVLTFVGGGHNGGDMHFGPDGFLYISTGDAAGPNPPDPLNTGQDCSDLLSSILRIDVNGERRDVSPPVKYLVPKDNPFVGVKDVRPEIWAFGFRNPWRMSFDRKTGALWVGDVGWELWEMVHKIEKGGNHGWSVTEARQPVKPDQKLGPSAIRPPMIELPHTIAASVTGGYVYRGKKFPELEGAYVFADWETRRVWAARFEGDRLKEMPEIVKPNVRISAFGEDNAGELYFAEYDTGLIYTFERNDVGAANAKFPTKLSETGLFADVKKHELAAGVVRFTPNAEQWQDGATARHYLALPGTSAVDAFDKPRPLPGQVFWHNFALRFPADAVLVKTITAPVGGRTLVPRIETQLLHFDGADWRGYTYAWRDDQSDADLVPAEGAEKVLRGAPWAAPGDTEERVWTFHSRNQCLSCHNAWSEYALAFSVPQLNTARVRAEDAPSQLVEWCASGHLRRVGDGDKLLAPFDEARAAKEPVLADPFGGTYSLDQRARAYLHANCAHCHRFGGGGGQVVLELDAFRPLKEMGILDARPKQGDFGLPDARLVAPGAPERSVLFYRTAKFGRGRMPHLGSELPHPAGLELLNTWIGALGNKPAAPYAKDAAGLDRAFATIGTALPLARGIGNGALPAADRAKVLAEAAKLPPGHVRDLFEGYLPPDPKGRKLGSNPRPASILALKGDANGGEALFFQKELKCANCHKMSDKGVSVGPDLTKIGATRTRAELLDSLLNPSARVEPQYAAYAVRTKDEKAYTGIVTARTEKELVLIDAEGKKVVVPGTEVESVRPSRLSLMPDGQMSGLTPQEAADLLEFLAQRK